MRNEKIRRMLQAALPLSARQALIAILEDAHKTAKDTHRPQKGGNNQLYGFSVAVYIEYGLKGLTTDPDRGGLSLRPVQDNGAFRIGCGDSLLFAAYRLPSNSDDPEDEFPYNNGAAGRLVSLNRDNSSNYWLFSSTPESEIPLPVAFVLAHKGDPTRGLTQASIREPIEENDGRICRWGYIEELWPNADDSTGESGVQTSSTPDFPPENPVSRPRVTPKENKIIPFPIVRDDQAE